MGRLSHYVDTHLGQLSLAILLCVVTVSIDVGLHLKKWQVLLNSRPGMVAFWLSLKLKAQAVN